MRRLLLGAGLVCVVVAAVMGVRLYTSEPPPPAPGLVRLTLARPGLPPLQHAHAGGAVSLNAMLSGDEAMIGMRGTEKGTGREIAVRRGQTIEVPGGTLTLVEVWDVWQRERDAVDVKLAAK